MPSGETSLIEEVGCLSWGFGGKISVDGVEGIPGTSDERH